MKKINTEISIILVDNISEGVYFEDPEVDMVRVHPRFGMPMRLRYKCKVDMRKDRHEDSSLRLKVSFFGDNRQGVSVCDVHYPLDDDETEIEIEDEIDVRIETLGGILSLFPDIVKQRYEEECFYDDEEDEI